MKITSSHFSFNRSTCVAGFSRFQLIEANRRERFAPKNNRHFEVLVWYPAQVGQQQETKAYLSGHRTENLRMLHRTFGSTMIHDEISRRSTASYEDAPISNQKEQYPVLLFSHELGYIPEYYTQLMELLAQQGYFVFSINHTYLSDEAVLSDLQLPKHNSIRMRSKFILYEWLLQRRVSKIVKKNNYEDRWLMSHRMANLTHLVGAPAYDWCEDKKYLLNHLEGTGFNRASSSLQPHTFFSGRLDLSSIGAIGHGWGGTSAVHSLLADKRVKAAINLNGFQFSGGIENAIPKPLLMIYSQQHAGMNQGIYFSTSEYEAVTIENATHLHFSDWASYSLYNTRQANLCFESITSEILPFFQNHLNVPDEIMLQSTMR